MKKFFTGIVLASFVLMGPVATYADTVTSATASAQVQSILAQIQNLQTQLKALQDLQTQVQTTQTSITSTLELVRSLREGMSGSDVTALQTLLAADPSIYPEGTVTGFYGKMTSEAIRRFQRKYGIENVGYVGPKTLKKLNEVLKELGLSKENGDKLCIPPGHLIAKGWLKKNSTTSIVTTCNNKHDNEGDHQYAQATSTPTLASTASASVVVGGLIHDTVRLAAGNNPTDTINFQVYGPSDTACATPLAPALPLVSVNGNGNYSSTNFTTTAIGTYRFTATYSGDMKNYSVHTSCNDSGSIVAVTAVPDTTAPVITALVATPAATTTVVSWTTSEPATGAVWFGITSPLALGTSTSVSSTSHSLTLSGLATSTPYNFQVVSTDASGNTATSTQGIFTTLAQ
jgi:peptidoglycan hydrolase-like protein with peptidoglycan-binding domain